MQLYHTTKTQIKKLQRAPDNVKKRWLIGGSAVFMILILGLWLVYVNKTLPPLAVIENPAQTSFSVPKTSSYGFFKILKLGIQNIFNNFKNQWQSFRNTLNQYWNSFKSVFQKTNNFSIQPMPEQKIIPPIQEPLPPTTLP